MLRIRADSPKSVADFFPCRQLPSGSLLSQFFDLRPMHNVMDVARLLGPDLM
jgi:hypothetical protein